MKKFSPFTLQNISIDKVIPVFQTDVSQSEAIALALSGKTFVLNGPPGTGKSHTISALLANALYRNKKVLFVSQKKSALQIVVDKLRSVGLDSYALALSDREKDNLDAWKNLLKQPPVPKTDYKQTLLSYQKLNQEMNAVHTALHNDTSLYADIEEYFQIDCDDVVKIDESFYAPFQMQAYERCQSLLFLYASLSYGVSLKEGAVNCYGDFFLCKRELLSYGVSVNKPFSSAKELLACFRKSFLKGYCIARIEKDFPSFSSYACASQTERLRFLKEQTFALAKDEVKYSAQKRISHQHSGAFYAEYKQLCALGYQLQKLNFVYNEFKHLRKITPCVIANVEQAKKIKDSFDIVVFDEASQILCADALPIAKKGDAVVIVGDEKQLPPTTFFSSAKGEQKQNILDYALAMGVYRHSLTRHYRSKNQELISFSNHKFYGDELYAFPSPVKRSCVTLHQIDGVYRRKGDKLNEKEVVALVDRALYYLTNREYQNKTLGIVTLSSVQRDEVERKLFFSIRKHKIPSERVRSANIFVKNLEAVQGEERDIILLSLCFGKDEDGKLSLRFGPLNHEGGERRLNVALTRAKEKTEVFSSLPESFLSAKSNSEGVNALREFLSYVKGGELAQKTNPVSSLSLDLSRRLKGEGYTAVCGVGNKNFVIDVAVRSGKDYKVGVLFDKKKNTPEELLFYTDFLKQCGWNVVCVYAVDYFLSPEREVEKILSHLQTLGVKPQKTKEKGEKRI